MSETNELITFRLFVMTCCGHQLCWVNPRMPNYCPECGTHVYPEVRSWPVVTDTRATLKYHVDDDMPS